MTKDEKRRKYKREWQRKWRIEHPTEQRIMTKKYQAIQKKRNPVGFKKRAMIAVRKWRLNNPEKLKAQRDVAKALKKGLIQREPCFCGAIPVQAHHDDYSKTLDVKWLCKNHHSLADKTRRKKVINRLSPK